MADQQTNRPLPAPHVLASLHPKSTDVPCLVVIFGGAGDLSHRKLLPALYNLMVDAELPRRLTAAMQTTAIRATRRAYSTKLAPRWFATVARTHVARTCH